MIILLEMDESNAEFLHKKHELLTEKIYNTPGMLPNRYVYILTNKCNLNCSFCFLERNSLSDSMKTKDWISLSNQLPDYARVTITGGEPLLFNGFKEVFSSIAEKYDCNIITNGILLNRNK